MVITFLQEKINKILNDLNGQFNDTHKVHRDTERVCYIQDNDSSER